MKLVLKKGASKKDTDEIHAKLHTIKGVNTKKYGGKIKLKEEPLAIQKQMRNEWR